MSAKPRLLMCPPEFYGVDYVINPWMEGNIHKSDYASALEQWQSLHELLKKDAEVLLVPPQSGLPDMVFTANAGLIVGNRAVLSRFFHRERRPEEPQFKKFFAQQGFEIFEMPPDLPFEGAGDALLDRSGGWLWAAYGSRTELDAHPLLAEWLEVEVLSLRLIDPRFYHLDTCLCPLEGGYLLYFPAAFDARSNLLIEERVPAQKRLAVSEADAVRFACNAVELPVGTRSTASHYSPSGSGVQSAKSFRGSLSPSNGDTPGVRAFHSRVYFNPISAELKMQLTTAGFDVLETPLTEFLKSGGSSKCLTLRLTEPKPAHSRALCTVSSRRLKQQGHLIDSGLLERALDLTVETGGSFQILQFHLGKQRQSPSEAEIKISAPTEEVLDKVMARLIDVGVVPASPEEHDAELQPVAMPGVAPDNFYATTIYPTEVRLHGHWQPVQDQRMDAVIVVGQEMDQAVARCKLFRHLKVGDQVVVGSDGIRTIRKTISREARAALSTEPEFAFMGAGVSSERRVELAVERISWEMRRIRDQGGKIVVVAGPVVVHTGGAEHLAWLIRNGYVQGVLGGNGVATHDIEQSILGTSLGVDLKRGASVHGGHQHHLRAINLIRRCGGIKPAVEQGTLTSGIFYECVKANIPFVLAGSIRDDGPLPDTEMDLLKAQDRYAAVTRGADMILMLSSMLHSIGVGNMTPAGVKLVCIDINPAVVTKLSDRGSVESIGVVTDVGLFLNLLAERLQKQETVREAA